MNCIYCDGLAEVPKTGEGEHIVPAAIGGKRTVLMESRRLVCERCNNGKLSTLDNELTRRSYLATVASQEIDSTLWQVWNVEPKADNLLIEARPSWKGTELANLVNYPQIMFETTGPQIRGDLEEMQAFGIEDYKKVLLKAAKRAFFEFSNGNEDALKSDIVETEHLESRGYRLPARLFARRSIKQISRKIHKEPMRLRYRTPVDRRLALRMLSRIDSWPEFKQQGVGIPSEEPTISIFADASKVLRGMFKIAYNLIAAYCKNTEVNAKTFKAVLEVIRGKRPDSGSLLARNGFVHASGVQSISHQGAHSFRLFYADSTTVGKHGDWWVYMSFFGGRIGAVVTFPGPKSEEWSTMDIIAPIKQKKWPPPKTYSLYFPLQVRVDWSDVEKIAPSLGMSFTKTTLKTELIPWRPEDD